MPDLLSEPMTVAERTADRGMPQRDLQAGDVRLHSSSEVIGQAA